MAHLVAREESRRKSLDGNEIMVYRTVHGDERTTMAAELLSRWGMVAAVPAGEDSGGRQKLRLLEPEEMVARACEVTELFFMECQRRGWLITLPVPELREIELREAG